MEKIFIGGMLGLTIGIIIGLLGHHCVIETQTKLTPTTELFIKDNKVDTLYIYKQLKTN